MSEKTTYYYEVKGQTFDRLGPYSFQAPNDASAIKRMRSEVREVLILYKESDTPNGLPFIEIDFKNCFKKP